MTTQNAPYTDPEVLRALYWDKGLNLHEIADRYNVHRKTIWDWFEKYNIDRRNQGSAVRYSETLPYRVDPSGYCVWSGSMGHDGFSTTFVHQLTAVAAGADPHKVYSRGDYHTHHKNGVPWDNRPENLEVLTPKEHAERHPERYDSEALQEYTDEELIEWVRAFVEEFGYVPTTNDIEGWPGPSIQTYQSRIGSWRETLYIAGWKHPNHPTDTNGRRIKHEEPKPVGACGL